MAGKALATLCWLAFLGSVWMWPEIVLVTITVLLAVVVLVVIPLVYIWGN